MKMFSRLSLLTLFCFGFALVLLGQSVDGAQHEKAGLKVIFSEEPDDIELINNAPSLPQEFGVQLTDAKGNGIKDAVIRFTSIQSGAVSFLRLAPRTRQLLTPLMPTV